MAVINIMKDGTVCDDMSNVTVPQDMMERIYAIYERSRQNDERREDSNGCEPDTNSEA